MNILDVFGLPNADLIEIEDFLQVKVLCDLYIIYTGNLFCLFLYNLDARDAWDDIIYYLHPLSLHHRNLSQVDPLLVVSHLVGAWKYYWFQVLHLFAISIKLAQRSWYVYLIGGVFKIRWEAVREFWLVDNIEGWVESPILSFMSGNIYVRMRLVYNFYCFEWQELHYPLVDLTVVFFAPLYRLNERIKPGIFSIGVIANLFERIFCIKKV